MEKYIVEKVDLYNEFSRFPQLKVKIEKLKGEILNYFKQDYMEYVKNQNFKKRLCIVNTFVIEDDYDSRTEYMLFNLKKEETVIKILEQELHVNMEGEHCRHSYDCCGNWYASRPKIIRINENRILVKIRKTMNV